MVLLLVASSTTVVLAEGGNRALMEQLRAGGVVIYFRHGITETTQSDHQPLNLEECAAQRNLSQAGREQMRAIGQAMNALQIPLGKVLASPYCRTLESGRLAFGRADGESRLRYVGPMTGQHRERQIRDLRMLLATPPAQGRNTVLIAHRGNLLAATGEDLAEGEAAVYRPEAGGGFTLVGRLAAEDWSRFSAVWSALGEPDQEECREPSRLPMD